VHTSRKIQDKHKPQNLTVNKWGLFASRIEKGDLENEKTKMLPLVFSLHNS
jgi:hypothetical protein